MLTDASLAPLPVATPQTAPSSGKRDALLRAALDLFAQRTYGAASVPDIAARAHIGTGTVYRACKNTMHHALLGALARGGTEKERFLGMWQGLASMAAADPVALHFLELQHHEEYLDEESRALGDAVFATAASFISEGQEAGAIRPADPSIGIALVFGAFIGLFKEASKGRYLLSDEVIVEAGECAWRMIAADSPA